MSNGLSVSAAMDLASGLRNFWYPVEFSQRLGASTPLAFELFDRCWVLFRDQTGTIACIQDECAHRACPLSLGQVVAGRIQCPYHGWEYDRQGECIHTPSCQPTEIQVETLPVVEQGGMIWVWPGEENPPNPVPDRAPQIPDNFTLQAELVMDLDVEHGLMMENLLDLAHAPFTHTGTFAKGWPVPPFVRFATAPHNPWTGHWDPYPIHMTFEPPCFVISTIGLRGQDCGRHLHQVHACLPRGRGKTRLLYRLALDFCQWLHLIPGTHHLWQYLANQVIQEDLRLVQGQQERLKAGGDVWRQPVGYDKLGVAYRRWRNQVECGSAEWPECPPLLESVDESFP
ncbi:MAG: Rieske 2Fe-2S domain-containing protein [Prochlorothrix sp.]